MSNTMTLEIPVKPEKVDEFVGIMKSALVDTRKYDGCQKVEMWTAEDSPGRLVLLEVWESKAHQEKYFAWRMESGMMEMMQDFLAGAPVVTWFEVHDS